MQVVGWIAASAFRDLIAGGTSIDGPGAPVPAVRVLRAKERAPHLVRTPVESGALIKAGTLRRAKRLRVGTCDISAISFEQRRLFVASARPWPNVTKARLRTLVVGLTAGPGRCSCW